MNSVTKMKETQSKADIIDNTSIHNHEQSVYYADQPTHVRFEQGRMWVELADGRIIATPLSWYPRLQQTTDKDRKDFFMSSAGIHWDNLDEDLSVEGMLKGRKPPRKK